MLLVDDNYFNVIALTSVLEGLNLDINLQIDEAEDGL